MGGAINRSFISAHFLLSAYFLTPQTYKRMCLITRVHGITLTIFTRFAQNSTVVEYACIVWLYHACSYTVLYEGIWTTFVCLVCRLLKKTCTIVSACSWYPLKFARGYDFARKITFSEIYYVLMYTMIGGYSGEGGRGEVNPK